MNDLVERLRFGGNNESEATRHEAADRIEALEAALREIVVACYSDYISHNINKIARAALKGEA